MVLSSVHSSLGTLSTDLIPWIYLLPPLYNHKGFDLGYPECPSGFPYLFQLKPEFCNKEFMVWATVSSRSCFCWLPRASSSLAAKNIITLISILTIWCCPCVESSLGLLEKCLRWPLFFLDKTVLAFALLHFVLQDQICLLFWVSLDFLLLHSNSLWWKGHLSFFGVSSRRSWGLHRTRQFLLLQH